jgi:hypothetical protein
MREKKRTFREWRNEAMIKAVAGEKNTARWNAPFVSIDLLYHSAEEIDSEIFFDFARGRKVERLVRINP